MNKQNIYFFKYNLQNKYIFDLSIFFGFAIFLAIIGSFNFSKGFDFTDATLAYHYSLKILNGEIPFKDFHLSVMPLTLYIEAFFHSVFGRDYIINSYLGFATKLIQSFFIYKIFYFFYGKRKISIIFSLFLICLVGRLQYPYHFAWTPLAIALSIISIYFCLLSVEKKIYNFVFGVFVGITFLTKQNFGIFLYIGYLFFQIISFYKFKFIFNRIAKKILFSIIGIFIILLPAFLFLSEYSSIDEIFYILTSGSERKGLNDQSFIQIIDTIVPVLNPKAFLATIVSAISVLFFIISIVKNNKKIFFFSTISISICGFLALSYHGIYKTFIELILYDGIKVSLPFLVVYFLVFQKKTNPKIVLFLILIGSVVIAHELGWIGRGYLLPLNTGILFFLLPKFFINKNVSVFNDQTNFMKKCFTIFNFLYLASSFLFPKPLFVRDFNANKEITIKPYLNNHKLSKTHKNAIINFRDIYNSHCFNEQLFVFPWAPILYTILDAENPTRFDLPYHDMLTPKEADEIIKILNSNPPCLIIVQEASLSKSGMRTPFPAKGMRKIEKYFVDLIPSNYIFIKAVPTYGKNHLIFKKK